MDPRRRVVYLKHLSADGKWVLIDYIMKGAAQANVGRVPLRPDGVIEPLVETRADDFAGALSPDGRYLAYQSDEGGTVDVFVREMNGSTGRWQISNAGGEEPMWSAGWAIHFLSLRGAPDACVGRHGADLPRGLADDALRGRAHRAIRHRYQLPAPPGRSAPADDPRVPDDTSVAKVRVITRWLDELKGIR